MEKIIVNDEMTKIVIKKCELCKKEVQIWTNESANIIGVRCPECFNIWKKNNDDIIKEDVRFMSADKCPVCNSNLRQYGYTIVCENECGYQKDI